MRLWICNVCGMVVEGDEPPATCPDCGAPEEEFRELTQDEIREMYGGKIPGEEDDEDDDDISDISGDAFDKLL